MHRHVRQHSEHSSSSAASSATNNNSAASTFPTTLTPVPTSTTASAVVGGGVGAQATSTPATPRKTKIKRALRSTAARVPSDGIKQLKSYSSGLGLGKGLGKATGISLGPPVVVLRVQVLGCDGLLGKDRGGMSTDPFVVISLLTQRFHMPVQKSTTNPTYAPATSTFDFPLYLSHVERLGMGSVKADGTHGVGTIRSYHSPTGAAGATAQLQYGDDGGLSSDTGDDQPTAVPLFPSAAHVDADAVGEDTQRASAGFVQPSPTLSPTATSRFNPRKLPKENCYLQIKLLRGAA
ncbi:hypothetical protein CVT25_013162 [Psilocybe cyanescens]|uniref:C2 domain-containing protein n=1 Tax=Psilocybe cyanescens TaxID=93625 RepID=A0A409XCJ2_PSICY|nr:hypothetical protein CVT25_013162 [Psilocybe cyanescens]